jgi:hypothetical protein
MILQVLLPPAEKKDCHGIRPIYDYAVLLHTVTVDFATALSQNGFKGTWQ